MASNSTKKVAKAARASAGRRTRSGQGRQLGYPVAIGVIVALGLAAIFFGREQRLSVAQVEPIAGDTHWHSAYGVYLCDSFLPDLTDQQGDRVGIHTHDDGLIHVHPFSGAASGEEATLQDFFDEVGLVVTDDSLEVPGGEVFENGDDCNGEEGEVVLGVWADAGSEDDPVRVTQDIGDVRFLNDGQAFTIAFVPEGADIPEPESVDRLDDVSDLDPFTTTTVAGTSGSGEADADSGADPTGTGGDGEGPDEGSDSGASEPTGDESTTTDAAGAGTG